MVKFLVKKIMCLLGLMSKSSLQQAKIFHRVRKGIRYRMLSHSRLFDKKWYVNRYADVKRSRVDPLLHYLDYGWKEGRDPSPLFSTNGYLKRYKDVRAARINPLFHYLKSGRKEGRVGLTLRFTRNRWFRFLATVLCRNQKTHLRILVVLHLFYPEQWVKIKEYLMTFGGCAFDLKVTIPEGYTDEATITDIREFSPGAEIITLPNIGYDVAPFIQVLNTVDLNQYDLVYKLQSKGINVPARYLYGQEFCFKDWFLNLYRGIFGLFRTRRIIKMFETDAELGLVAAQNLIVEDPSYKKHFTSDIAASYGISLNPNYRYVAGTCFAARSSALMKIKELGLQLSDFEVTKRGEFSTAHAFERIICAIVENAGYRMKGLKTFHRRHLWALRKRRRYSSQRLLNQGGFVIDDEFFYKVLEQRSVYRYEITEMRLGAITRLLPNGKVCHLRDAAAYKFLSDEENGQAIYEKYCEENAKDSNFVMSAERYGGLRESMSTNGFDERNMPVVDEYGRIMDGQHRSCILLNEYGPDHTINVLRLWMRPKPSLQDRLTNMLKPVMRMFTAEMWSPGIALIRKSRYFNRKWYLTRYPDVKKAHLNPAYHYWMYGWREGRDPGPDFSTSLYLRRYPDVRKAKINPLLHYEKSGRKEGRSGSVIYRVEGYRARALIALNRFLDRFARRGSASSGSFRPLISIVVASYNYEHLIVRTLDSLLAQTYTNFEVIVFDDGSADNSVRVVKKYAKKYNNVHLYTHRRGKNLGLGATLKAAIDKAKGEYVAFCESDDYWHPRHLEEKLSFIRSHRNVSVLANQVELVGDSRLVAQKQPYIDRVNALLIEGCNYFNTFSDPRVNPIPTFSGVMIKRACLEGLDYDSPIPAWLDLWLYRQILAKNKLYYTRKKLTYWYLHDSYNGLRKAAQYAKKFDMFQYQLALLQGKGVQSFARQALRSIKGCRAIAKSDLFDGVWYRQKYQIGRAINPVVHYWFVGWRKGYNPSTRFDTRKYLDAYPMVRQADICPLAHWELNGVHESIRCRFHTGEETPTALYPENYVSSSGKRILLVSHMLNHTGAPILLLEVGKLFKRLGYEVFMLAPKPGDLVEDVLKAHIPVFLSEAAVLPPKYALNLPVKFDYCICNTYLSWAAYRRYSKSVPTIWWIHENLVKQTMFPEAETELRNAEMVYVPSELTRSYVSKFASRTKLLPYPIQDKVDRMNTERRDKIKFAVLGTLNPRKAQDVFVKAVSDMSAENLAKAEFEMVGDCPANAKSEMIRDLAMKSGLVNVRKPILSLEKYHRYLDTIDVLVCPSRADPFPLVVVDALMHGRACIVTDHVGQASLIERHDAGRIVRAGDRTDLAAAMTELIEDADKLESLKNNARNAFTTEFKVDTFIQTVESVFK